MEGFLVLDVMSQRPGQDYWGYFWYDLGELSSLRAGKHVAEVITTVANIFRTSE